MGTDGTDGVTALGESVVAPEDVADVDATDLLTAMVGAAAECLLAVGEDGRVVAANPAVDDVFGHLPEAIIDEPVADLVGEEGQERLLSAADGADAAHLRLRGRHRKDYELPVDVVVQPADGAGPASVVAAVRDVTTYEEVGEQLESLRDDFDRLETITAVIREVDRAAVRATARAEFEQQACEGLVSSGPYVAAWIGEPDHARGTVALQAAAGVDADHEDASVELDEPTSRNPAERAAATHEVQVERDVQPDPAFEPWGGPAIEDPYRAVAAVPIVYDEALYGVLTMYAARPLGFEGWEQEVLEELGEMMALVTTAFERRRALLTDSVVEVEVELRGGRNALTRVSARTGARFSLEGTVPQSADTFVVYLAASGAEPGELVDRLLDDERVHQGRVVVGPDTGAEAESLLELVVDDALVTRAVADHGGTVTDLVVEDGVGRITIEAPHGADVRKLVRTMGTTTEEVELVAQRTAERPVRTERSFRAAVTERLTDRQRAALRAAYFAGYHDRPRTSTGEEVAETLEVSPSTFHQHHRVGVRKLLAAAFEPGGAAREE